MHWLPVNPGSCVVEVRRDRVDPWNFGLFDRTPSAALVGIKSDEHNGPA